MCCPFTALAHNFNDTEVGYLCLFPEAARHFFRFLFFSIVFFCASLPAVQKGRDFLRYGHFFTYFSEWLFHGRQQMFSVHSVYIYVRRSQFQISMASAVAQSYGFCMKCRGWLEMHSEKSGSRMRDYPNKQWVLWNMIIAVIKFK